MLSPLSRMTMQGLTDKRRRVCLPLGEATRHQTRYVNRQSFINATCTTHDSGLFHVIHAGNGSSLFGMHRWRVINVRLHLKNTSAPTAVLSIQHWANPSTIGIRMPSFTLYAFQLRHIQRWERSTRRTGECINSTIYTIIKSTETDTQIDT